MEPISSAPRKALREPPEVSTRVTPALANASMFAPYKVANWPDVPDDIKDTKGRWLAVYGGYMSIGYDLAGILTPKVVHFIRGMIAGALKG